MFMQKSEINGINEQLFNNIANALRNGKYFAIKMNKTWLRIVPDGKGAQV